MLFLPVTGPGNYFVGIAVQLAILTPLLVFGLSRAPLTTLAVAGVLSLGFELIVAAGDVLDAAPYVYDVSALRYVFLFALAMWAIRLQVSGKQLPWVPLALYLAASVTYMLFAALTGNNLVFPDAWGWQNLASFGYVLVALLIGIRLLLRTTRERASPSLPSQLSRLPLPVGVLRLAAGDRASRVHPPESRGVPCGWDSALRVGMRVSKALRHEGRIVSQA